MSSDLSTVIPPESRLAPFNPTSFEAIGLCFEVSKLGDSQRITSCRTSEGQRQAYDALRRLGYECELEVNRLHRVLSIDILARDASTGKAFAVEFDGPSHYLRSAFTASASASSSLARNDGPTVLRNNLITMAAGLDLIVIPYYDWDEASRSGNEARDDYLRKIIASRR